MPDLIVTTKNKWEDAVLYKAMQIGRKGKLLNKKEMSTFLQSLKKLGNYIQS